MPTIVRRIIAVLKLLAAVAALSKQAKAIVAAMTNNAFFPTPNPPLPTVTNDIAALDAAEALALGKGKGTANARNAKKAVVIRDLQLLRNYVQMIADNDADHAEQIITSALMAIKKLTPRQKRETAVKQGIGSGIVELFAVRAAAKALYQWQMSTDMKVWTNLPQTFLTKTTVTGLVAGTTYYFRYQVVTRAGVSDWSQIISILVK